MEAEEQVLPLNPLFSLWFANMPRVTPRHSTVTQYPWFGSFPAGGEQAARVPALHSAPAGNGDVGAHEGQQHPLGTGTQGKAAQGAMAEAGQHRQVAMVPGAGGKMHQAERG